MSEFFFSVSKQTISTSWFFFSELKTYSMTTVDPFPNKQLLKAIYYVN